DPVRGAPRVLPRHHAAELVIADGHGLAVGIGLSHDLTESVVRVRPYAHIRIDLPDLAPAIVVDDAHAVSRRTRAAGGRRSCTGLDKVAVRIVHVRYPLTVRIGNRCDLPEYILRLDSSLHLQTNRTLGRYAAETVRVSDNVLDIGCATRTVYVSEVL